MTVLWCVLTITLAAFVLIILFQNHVNTQVEEELNSHVIQLVSLTEPDGAGSYRLRSQMADPRYSRPLSSWVWQVRRGDDVILQSASAGPQISDNQALMAAPLGTVGEFEGPQDTSLTGLAREIRPRFSQERLTFVVARPTDQVRETIARFRNIVLVVLALFGLGQTATAAWLVYTGLKPLTALRDWVAQMRDGAAPMLTVKWPTEIRPVVQEIEELEHHVDRLVERARSQAADLAHAIKTPLSVLRQIGEEYDGPDADQLRRQNYRIDAALQRHLARVRVAGRAKRKVNIRKIAEDLRFALQKPLEMNNIRLRMDVHDAVFLTCDENDVYEIVGNLLDNASKWAASQITLRVSEASGSAVICVEDDGPGIDPEKIEAIFERGHRADETRPGHGLGLSIVRELVELYAGQLSVSSSDLGGAQIKVVFGKVAEPA